MQRELLSGAATADALKAGQSVIGQDVLPPLCAHIGRQIEFAISRKQTFGGSQG
jgi:hypothetical protein